MRLIELGGKYGSVAGRYTLVDESVCEKYELSGYNWHAWKVSRYSSFYAATNIGYGRGNRTILLMHRLITDCRWSPVDHICGNPLDNRLANLRDGTGINMKNSMKLRGKNKYKGAYWHEGTGKWLAYIQVGSKRVYLGLFDDEIEAALAYDEVARVHFGKYGRYSFPRPGERPALTPVPCICHRLTGDLIGTQWESAESICL